MSIQDLDSPTSSEDEEFSLDSIKLHTEQKKMSKITCMIMALLLFFLLSIIGFIFYLSYHVKSRPIIYDTSYVPFDQNNQLAPKRADKKLLSSANISEPKIFDGMINTIQLQIVKGDARGQVNQDIAGVRYRKVITDIDYEIALKYFDDIRQQQIFRKSNITYDQYLKAINRLRLSGYGTYEQRKQIEQQEQHQYSKKYGYFKSQLPFCIISPLQRNSILTSTYKFGLKSVLHQKYTNYRLIVINLAPSLSSQDLSAFLSKNDLKNKRRVTLIKSKQNMQKMKAIYYAAGKYCKYNEIMLILGDNEELIGQNTLSLLNSVYQKQKPSVVYSNYLVERNIKGGSVNQTNLRYFVPIYQPFDRITIKSNNFRHHNYQMKHIKTFKAQYFLSIPEDKFQFQNGTWYSNQIDSVIEFSILQITCGNFFHIPEILYKAVQKTQIDHFTLEDIRAQNSLPCISFSSNDPKIRKVTKTLVKTPDSLQYLNMKLQSSKSIFDNQKFNRFHTQRQRQILYSFQIYDTMKKDKKSLEKQLKPRTNITHDKLKSAIKNMLATGNQLKERQTYANNNDTFFCVIVPTYNNVENYRYLYNIESILMQEYNNYKVIIIDDASTDNTSNQILNYALKMRKKLIPKITIVKRQTRKYATANIFFAARQHCKENQVLMVIDGDDQLIGNSVFQAFNQAYKNGANAVYSNHLRYHNGTAEVGLSKQFQDQVIQKSTFRNNPVYFSHLRSFRAKYFFDIRVQDLKDEKNNWFRTSADMAISYPALQMACKKIHYIPELLYRYNVQTGQNVYEVAGNEQERVGQYLKSKEKYRCLTQ